MKFLNHEVGVGHPFETRILPSEHRWDTRTLRLLLQAVLNSLEEKYRHQHQPSLVLAPLVEGGSSGMRANFFCFVQGNQSIVNNPPELADPWTRLSVDEVKERIN